MAGPACAGSVPGDGHPYDADTAVVAGGEHRFTATISDRWNGLTGRPLGGFNVAVCLRALMHELPFPDPLAVSSFFLRPVMPGPAELVTEVARRGRRMATGEVRLKQDDLERVRVVATFADLGSVAHPRIFGARPDLPPPELAVDVLGGETRPGATITDRIECRMAGVPGWRTGRPGGTPDVSLWMRFREGRDADTLALPILVDAAAPAVFEIGETGSTTLELTVHVRARPAPGWLACRVTTRCVASGYHEEDFEVWDSAGRLVAQSRQLALLTGA
jgi:acyl-CoA thioesterase